MSGIEHIVAAGPGRLDRILADHPSIQSRRRARECVETGKVHVDGSVATDPGQPVQGGARIELRWNQPGSGRARVRGATAMQEAGVQVLHHDQDVIVIDKPPGLLTDVADRQQARERDSVRKRLAAWLRPATPHICHRIDRDTSGVVVVATSERAAESLRAQFANHEPQRIYLAVVHGVPDEAEGTWEDHTVWDSGAKKLRRTHERAPGAMPTRTAYRVLTSFGCAALLELTLDTGRRNQIRLQASLRGHPLVGERLYVPPRFHRDELDLSRQALHALRVGFRHPATHQPLVVEAPVPADIEGLLRRLRRGPSDRPQPPAVHREAHPPHVPRRR